MELAPITATLDDPAMARVYTELRDAPRTVPELVSDVPVSRVTAYDYVERLADAGLVREGRTGVRTRTRRCRFGSRWQSTVNRRR